MKKQIIEALVAALEIPASYYETAQNRYNDLGTWFCRVGGDVHRYKPRIYPQGSFRLGTVIRPLHADESYDLDIGCRLEAGITKHTHSQENLKTIVGDELEAYRVARRIEKELEEMHRCWRLEYADTLNFHMDIVPSIPEESAQRTILAKEMTKNGLAPGLAQEVARHSGSITDNRSPHYRTLHPDWKISNSEGYAKWFESRLALASELMENVAVMARAEKVDKLPAWKWKSPLQKAIQILKRHRDSMFVNQPDSKPISIILTTLAAAAYRGEEDTSSAVERILSDMDSYVLASPPRVPNPVNPNEDFADKWHDPKYAGLKLEENFKLWLQQARQDFKNLEKLVTEGDIQKFTEKKFTLRLPQAEIAKILPFLSKSSAIVSPVSISTPPARPWAK